jgi:MscS family membrane protein
MYRRADSKNYGAFLGFLPFFENVLNGLVIFLGGLVVAGQLGYKTSGVFAMFGLSGAVLAFAMKDVFANFVNALILVMDRPFRPGDHVKVGEIDAIVESIGIRSTRLRTLDDVLVVLPNAAIVNLPVYNIRSQKKWHIHEVLEFDSNTTSSSIAEWVRRSRDFLSHHDQIDPETIHVYFEHFSSRSLTLHLSCTTTAMNKTAYVDVRQALNLCLLDFCNQLSIRLVQTTH